MKKIAVLLTVMLLVVSFSSMAFAEQIRGAIKSVDAKAGTVEVVIGGESKTMKADKSVDLGKLKEGQKVIMDVENDVIKDLKVKKERVAVGC